MSRRIPRRDRCYFVGLRAARLYPDQAAIAWQHLAKRVESLGDKDLPKYADLISAIRDATFSGKHRIPVERPSQTLSGLLSF